MGIAVSSAYLKRRILAYLRFKSELSGNVISFSTVAWRAASRAVSVTFI